jgi:hypothetical protein
MKKAVSIIAAALLLVSPIFAQETPGGRRGPRGNGEGGERPARLSTEEIVKNRTESMVQQFGLNETQASQLTELNNRYAGKISSLGFNPMEGQEMPNFQEMTQEQRQEMMNNMASRMEEMQKMRADLEECGKGIYSRGFPWGMVTDAYGRTPERYQRLLASGLHSRTISLDGLQEIHDWLRGMENSFERASKAI